jgi:hypothetical protein
VTDERRLHEGLGGVPVWRSGRGVHRLTGPWTPTVHAFLGHLESVGFDGAPRVLGIDDAGREIFTFIEGEVLAAGTAWRPGDPTPWPSWAQTEDCLVATAQLLRRFHDAAATAASGAGQRSTLTAAATNMTPMAPQRPSPTGPGDIFALLKAARQRTAPLGRSLIGFPEEDAHEVARAANCSITVASRDGTPQAVTAEYATNRIFVTIENGIVVLVGPGLPDDE